jgi:predicted subunit of tRNA(5-methylaminomethyl-2-thiouridylate) methyltransferase
VRTAAVLFSGGRDSALAALLLEPHLEVTLVTCGFGVTDAVEHAARAAQALSIPHETVDLPRPVLESAVDRTVADGHPSGAIQQVHERALEAVATGRWDVVADGTRRDDRTPAVSRPVAQSLEDRHDVGHAAPLAGLGSGVVEALAERRLRVERGPSESVPKGDYETALRALLRDREGSEAVGRHFPAHTQSRVVGRRVG